jgi:hypothetical protein
MRPLALSAKEKVDIGFRGARENLASKNNNLQTQVQKQALLEEEDVYFLLDDSEFTTATAQGG